MRGRTLLGNEKYAHPKFHRYETAEDAQTAAGGTVTAPPVEPPPPQGRQPGEIPVLGGPGMPVQYLPAPGKQSQAQPGRRGVELARASGHKVMDMRDVDQAMEETGKSRAEVLSAATGEGVYGVWECDGLGASRGLLGACPRRPRASCSWRDRWRRS